VIKKVHYYVVNLIPVFLDTIYIHRRLLRSLFRRGVDKLERLCRIKTHLVGTAVALPVGQIRTLGLTIIKSNALPLSHPLANWPPYYRLAHKFLLLANTLAYRAKL